MRVARRSADRPVCLVALKVDPIDAELNIVPSVDLRKIIGKAIHRVGMFPGHIARVHCKTLAAVCLIVTGDHYARDFPTGTVIKDRCHTNPGRSKKIYALQRDVRPGFVCQSNFLVGIAYNQLIEQGGRQSLRHSHDRADAWAVKIILYRRESVLCERELRDRSSCIPGIVNIVDV